MKDKSGAKDSRGRGVKWEVGTFEKILWIIILAGAFFAGIAQWDMKKEHDEKMLKRQLMYKQFLEQGECRIQGAQGSRIPVNFTRTLESSNP